MTDLRKAAKMALEALENTARSAVEQYVIEQHAVEALRQALAQPEQEPVAYWNGKDMFKRADEVQYVVNWTDYYHYPLYSEPRSCPTCESLARAVMMDQTSHDTAPPKCEWQGLTDEEISTVDWKQGQTLHDFARAIEAKLKEKNT